MAGDPKKAAKILGIKPDQVSAIQNILKSDKALKLMGMTREDALKAIKIKIKISELEKVLKAEGLM